MAQLILTVRSADNFHVGEYSCKYMGHSRRWSSTFGIKQDANNIKKKKN
jgi:hypothetical protein